MVDDFVACARVREAKSSRKASMQVYHAPCQFVPVAVDVQNFRI